MIIITMRRKSTGASSHLQVNPNDTIFDALQMAMFDIGKLEVGRVSVSTVDTIGVRYYPMNEPLLSLGFKDQQSIEFIISETEPSKLKDVISKFQRFQTDPETTRLQSLDRIREDTFDAYPEMFMPIHMLYLNVIVNGQKIHCLVDTGAHNSVMSIDVVEKCGLTPWIDPRIKGKAIGVGVANVVGMIYNTDIHINGHVYPISLSVLDQRSCGSVDFLFGLDMLRRHGCIVDLKRYELIFDDGNKVPFLSAEESTGIERGTKKD